MDLIDHPGWLVLSITGLSLMPLAVAVLTSYMKVSIVLGILRSGLGAQQVPSNLVLAVLAMALSFHIMSPVLERSLDRAEAIDKNQLKNSEYLTRSVRGVLAPWIDFLYAHSGKRELASFSELDQQGNALNLGKRPPLRVLLPAFVISELKESFSMAFVILLPFLVIDLIVSNILVGLGMFMVSPIMISLPLKIAFFVASDAWLLLSRALVYSYR